MNKKIDDLLNFQKQTEKDSEYSEAQQLVMAAYQSKYEELMARDNVEEVVKNLLKQDYEAFKKVWEEVVAEKKEEASFHDAIERLESNNLWIKILKTHKLSEEEIESIRKQNDPTDLDNLLEEEEEEVAIH